MNLPYIFPRLARHFLPEKIVRALLLRGLIIRPGMETRLPGEAAARYQKDLKTFGNTLAGKRVLVFGYGGRFHLACNLLSTGVKHVILCEYAVKPDEKANAGLIPEYEKYLSRENGKTIPRGDWITMLQGDIRDLARSTDIQKVDIVLSTSVFEHLTDPEGILEALARLTEPEGVHLHYVDLRDHFFKYPFEMLTFSNSIWKNWLNPSSNLNRWRLPAYEKIFQKFFNNVEIEILEHNYSAWKKIAPKILPEFQTGDINIDAVAQIRVIAGKLKI